MSEVPFEVERVGSFTKGILGRCGLPEEIEGNQVGRPLEVAAKESRARIARQYLAQSHAGIHRLRVFRPARHVEAAADPETIVPGLVVEGFGLSLRQGCGIYEK